MRDLYNVVGFFLAFITIGIASATCCGGFDDYSASRHALESQGFKLIDLKDHAIMSCGEGDVSAINFDALNARDDRVSGVVCCGFLKSCTVRF